VEPVVGVREVEREVAVVEHAREFDLVPGLLCRLADRCLGERLVALQRTTRGVPLAVREPLLDEEHRAVADDDGAAHARPALVDRVGVVGERLVGVLGRLQHERVEFGRRPAVRVDGPAAQARRALPEGVGDRRLVPVGHRPGSPPVATINPRGRASGSRGVAAGNDFYRVRPSTPP
jgi:hypothetical protein